MHVTIKNAEAAHIDLASKSYHLNVDIDGIEADDLLAQIDIITAINYYGMMELLDTIGEENLKRHLECLQGTINESI